MRSLSELLCWYLSAWQAEERCFRQSVDDATGLHAALHAGVRHVALVGHFTSPVPGPGSRGDADRSYFQVERFTKTIRGNCSSPAPDVSARWQLPGQCHLSVHAGYGFVDVFSLSQSRLWIDRLYVSIQRDVPPEFQSDAAAWNSINALSNEGSLWVTRTAFVAPAVQAPPGDESASIFPALESACLVNYGSVFMQSCTVAGFQGKSVVENYNLLLLRHSLFADNFTPEDSVVTTQGFFEESRSVTQLVNVTVADSVLESELRVLNELNKSAVASDNENHRLLWEQDVSVGGAVQTVQLPRAVPADLAAKLLDDSDYWFTQMLNATGGQDMLDDVPDKSLLPSDDMFDPTSPSVPSLTPPDFAPTTPIDGPAAERSFFLSSGALFIALVGAVGATVVLLIVVVMLGLALRRRERAPEAPTPWPWPTSADKIVAGEAPAAAYEPDALQSGYTSGYIPEAMKSGSVGAPGAAAP